MLGYVVSKTLAITESTLRTCVCNQVYIINDTVVQNKFVSKKSSY